MKMLAIFLLFAVASQLAYAGNVHPFQGDIVRGHVEKIFGDKIKSSLENFKKVMKTGNEELGIPKLDPFGLEYYEINVNEKLITADGNFSSFYIEGLSDYTVEYANYKLFTSTIVIDMTWSSIKARTTYDVNATLLNKYPVYGAGDTSFELQNFGFGSNIKVNLDLGNNKVSIVSMSNTKISLEKLKFKITGIYDDEWISQILGAVISQVAPEFLVELQEEITSQVNKIMVKVGNEILKRIDIMALINS